MSHPFARAAIPAAIVLLFTAGSMYCQAADMLRVFSAPEGAARRDSFSVRVRTPGSAWCDVPVHAVRVNLSKLSQASFACFDFAGTVEVEVTFHGQTPGAEVKSAVVRPLSSSIVPKRSGNVITFTLDRPANLSVEIDGDRLQNLHLFASAPDTQVPSVSDPDVIYFGPGLHKLGTHPAITNDGKIGGQDQPVIHLSSGKTLYLAGGAVVQAAIRAEEAQNITIRGRGILDLSPWNEPEGYFVKGHTWQTPAIRLSSCAKVRIEGIIIRQPTSYCVLGGQSHDIEINGLKALGAHEWGDGIDMMSCSNVRISNAFLRTSDDCIAVYGSRWQFHGDSRNWVVKDSTFWADKAHPIYIGVSGDYHGNGDTLEELEFRNIDILEANEKHEGFLGALSIGCGDKNTCRNITFDNIRVDHIFERGRLLDVQFKHWPPSTVDGRSIENIAFRNITCSEARGSLLEGKGPEQAIRGVVFENLRVKGLPVLAPEQGSIVIGKFVEGVDFR